MSWNDQLCIYTQKRGGTYLGRMEEKRALTDESYMQHGGMAFLTHKGTPLSRVNTWTRYQNRQQGVYESRTEGSGIAKCPDEEHRLWPGH